jgi:hypothetical protein
LNYSKSNIAWSITIGVFILHFLPYFIYPGDAYIRIHDTLEGEWVWLDVLNKSNTVLDFHSDTKIDQVMNGLPRSTMPTGLSMMMALVKIFGTYWGYVINYMLVHIVGFAAMFFFLRTHVFKKDEDKALVLYISLLFSLIPVYTPFGLSVMSQPTLIHIFILALKHKAKYYHHLLLLMFPLYSSLVWMGMPLLMLLGMFWIYKLVKYKRIFPQYLLGLAVLSISYALVNYNLFQLIFDPPPGFVSHRSAYNLYMFDGPRLGTSLVDFAHQFFTLHYHVGTMVTLPILILGIVVYKSRHPLFKKLFILVLSIVLFQAFYNYFEFYIGEHIEFVKSFRLNRFNIVLPVIWAAGLALIFREMQQTEFLKKLIPISILTLLLSTGFGNDEILNNYRRIAGMYHLPTFKEYMAPDQFKEIKKTIGEDPKNYRVACIGMNPAILQYNGFYTLDGLQSIYDLNYKNQFRKIFANELEKNKEIKEYFDGWGNRCYIFSAVLGKEWISTHSIELTSPLEIELDAEAFKKMGGKYIITPFECNFMMNGGPNDRIALIKSFQKDHSIRHLYLYEITQAD